MIPADTYQSLGEILHDALVQHKSSVALIEVNRKRENRRLTYLDFRKIAHAFARWLQREEFGSADRTAIIMSNQSKWLLGAYGVFFRGGILVPLDYKLTAPEQASLLEHSKPKALIVEYPAWRKFSDGDLDGVDHVIVTAAPDKADLGSALRWEKIIGQFIEDGTEPVFIPRERDDVATIVYSSGTGGRPKGCMLTHRNYLAQYHSLSQVFEMTPSDRFFSLLPTNHAIDFMSGFIAPFCCGSTVIHQRTLRPEFITSTMEKYGVTHMAVVPLLLTAFEKAINKKLDQQSPLVRRAIDLLGDVNETLTRRKPNTKLSRRLLKPIHDAFGGHVKVMFCGGAFTDKERVEFLYRLGLPVAIGYGLTEACTVATVNDLKPFRADSVGRPVPNVEVRIRDANEHGIGEVYLSGPTIMKGYLDDPEQTAEVLQDGWFKTGDLGYLDASNHLHLVGRAKNMIVTEGGKNIYPEDIEAAFESLDCEEFAVFAANYVWPGGAALTGEQLVLVVRSRKGTRKKPGPTKEAFLDELRPRNRRLLDFKRVSGVVFWDEEFPRTASMKLKRHLLAEELRAAHSRDAIEVL